MKFTCPECRGLIKLSLTEIQKPKCSITCPSCQKTINMKNNVPLAQSGGK